MCNFCLCIACCMSMPHLCTVKSIIQHSASQPVHSSMLVNTHNWGRTERIHKPYISKDLRSEAEVFSNTNVMLKKESIFACITSPILLCQFYHQQKGQKKSMNMHHHYKLKLSKRKCSVFHLKAPYAMLALRLTHPVLPSWLSGDVIYPVSLWLSTAM